MGYLPVGISFPAFVALQGWWRASGRCKNKNPATKTFVAGKLQQETAVGNLELIQEKAMAENHGSKGLQIQIPYNTTLW